MSKTSREAAGPCVLAAASSYVARGWSVVPLERRGKRPVVAWIEFQQRLPRPDEIQDWFAAKPQANVGIVTGAVSGLVVLDVDPRHAGAESLAELEGRHQALPVTIEAVSGGGGRHFYFSHPGDHVANRAGIAPGLDLRGDGGLVVAPPSVHPTGRHYAWRPGRAPDELALAPLPEWLRNLLHAGARRGHSLAYWRTLVAEGVREGQRNNTLASLAGHLLWHGVDPDVVLELLHAWNRQRCMPPLDDAEVIDVVHSIVRLHQRAAVERSGEG